MLPELVHFPFSAVAGQSDFKLALLLAAVNPAIGGVLISGPRGCAKSTLARAMADLLPSEQQAFVTLPLGATDDMLVGTLDLQRVLSEQEVAFHPGLLSRAHEGVLYVDEVNLLADGLVDVLLDVAASGVNRVERDGISHAHAAEFILVGTMNPDEGELRPQLQDRFGLAVELSNQYPIAERMDIVRLREAFDRDASAFCASFAAQQQALIRRVVQARQRLADVSCADQWREQIAQRCFAAQVEGLRADIVWFRAALAHAAWHDRNSVNQQDIDAVAELVLVHRRKVSDEPSGKGGSDTGAGEDPSSDAGGSGTQSAEENKPNDNPYRRPPSSRREPSTSKPQRNETDAGADNSKATGSSESSGSTENKDSAESSGAGDWGSMSSSQLQAVVSADSLGPEFMNALEHCRTDMNALETRANTMAGASKVRGAGVNERVAAGTGKGTKPNWFASLLASAGQWPPQQLRFRQPQPNQSVLHMVLLDTSASGLQADASSGLLASAKAAVLDIARSAYLQREQLSILGFGNQSVIDILPRVRAPKALRAQLDAVQAGGGTPVREVLLRARDELQRLLRQQPGLRLQTYLISDGRTTQALNDIQLPGQCVVIDTEVAQVKRGRGAEIAKQLRATYLPLAGLSLAHPTR